MLYYHCSLFFKLKADTIKPIFTHIGCSPQEQIIIVERNLPYFSTTFHFHPECELVYIVEGNGKRIVGDSVEAFNPGDLVFLGSNISHVWYSDEAYYKEPTALHAKAIVIYFNKDIFGPGFYALDETKCLKALFHKAERGMKITGSHNQHLYALISTLVYAKGLSRIIGLLQVLEVLSAAKEYELLASIGYHNTYDTKDNHKIDGVFKYISQNFFKDIYLEDMARLCHMARPHFCRFFKKRTQMTFFDFLNEFRISHAKKLLIEKEENTVREIAYECGFNNISNFNRIFKSVVGLTPKEYKEKHKQPIALAQVVNA